jgi:hypothetical protein
MHAVLLRALQAVALLLGLLILRSVLFVARLYYARWSYSSSKAFSKIPGPPPAKLAIGGHFVQHEAQAVCGVLVQMQMLAY